ncbi:MAG: S24/S26 family peptidase [Pseudomonadota bacterium]
MLGWKIARIKGGSMEPLLPDGSFALFRAVKSVKRSDVVLVDHPEFGLIVKQVYAVSMDGTVGLRGLSHKSTSARRLGNVDFDRIVGRMVARLDGSLLPKFGSSAGPEHDHSEPEDAIDAREAREG